MEKHLYYYSNHTALQSSTDQKNIHNVVYCDNEAHVHYDYHDYSQDYFTTVARENGTISFNIWKSMGTDMITSISYSTNNGETWTTTNNTNNKSEHLVITVNVNEGDKVMWKGDATQLGYYDESDYGLVVGSFFSSTARFDVIGNIMSLCYTNSFVGNTSLSNDYQFACLFYDVDENKVCYIVNAENLILPATILTDFCYQDMFHNCGNLVYSPKLLPAGIAKYRCYYNMFHNCDVLTTTPKLCATTLDEECYMSMFWGCTSLTTAPELPATTLATSCYCEMFYDCTSLTVAPELPATTLANACYSHMFQGCTSLTTAPALPATTLESDCYNSMFESCANLNYIKAMFTTTPSTDYTSGWVGGVASSGTFVKNATATWNVSGSYGVPSGWTVETASN